MIKILIRYASMNSRLGPHRWALLTPSLLAVALIILGGAAAGQKEVKQPAPPAKLTSAEFSQLINEISEEGGYFRSDNFTSNETSYLYVVDKLRELGARGGAYIGVGPEQNFTYIAKIRPQVAFIIDIRRQAVIQHLMFKAVFHLSPDRVQYLSRLLARPLPREKGPGPNSSLEEILNYFEKTPMDEKACAANLTAIRKTIEEDFKFPLAGRDSESLEYVYKNFCVEGLGISYRVDGSSGNWSGYFPTMGEIIAQPDQHGKPGNFLASNDDYNFIRNMHANNLIIPVVGDFAGKKALAGIGDYLRKNGLTVTAYYTSNVEQYLFGNDSFADFANNVRKLPITEKSLFIRAITGRFYHPAQLPGHRLTTLLQQMTVFIKDFDADRYQTYRDLVSTNFIAPEMP